MTDQERYAAAAHKVQTAWAFLLGDSAMSPKHLRTGIDMSKSDMRGLANLLITKGVFTLEEYTEAMADSAEQEAAEFEALLTKKFGKPVVLK